MRGGATQFKSGLGGDGLLVGAPTHAVGPKNAVGIRRGHFSVWLPSGPVSIVNFSGPFSL